MNTKNNDRKNVLLNLIEFRVSNLIFALAGMLIFAVLKDSEWEQIFFVCFVGIFMLYNLIQGFFLLSKYQDEPTFGVSYETAKKALSNNIPEMMESIKKSQKDDDGKV